MAKFMLSFKGMPIDVYHFDSGSIHIGRDESNAIRIDSLAVAPDHAAVTFGPDGPVIGQINDDYPLIVNDRKTRTHKLASGDEIVIGKHMLTYSAGERVLDTVAAEEDPVLKALNKEIDSAQHFFEANLQVVNGKYIGRVIPLKRALTRLGKSGHGVAVIAKRKEGFFISALERGDLIKINKMPANDESVLLKNGDIVEMDQTALQFHAQE